MGRCMCYLLYDILIREFTTLVIRTIFSIGFQLHDMRCLRIYFYLGDIQISSLTLDLIALISNYEISVNPIVTNDDSK